MQSILEKLQQVLTRTSPVTVRWDEYLAGDIMIIVYKWCCSKDVNALAPKINLLFQEELWACSQASASLVSLNFSFGYIAWLQVRWVILACINLKCRAWSSTLNMDIQSKLYTKLLILLTLPGRYTDLTWTKDVHTCLKCNLVNFDIPNGFLYYGNDFGI